MPPRTGRQGERRRRIWSLRARTCTGPIRGRRGEPPGRSRPRTSTSAARPEACATRGRDRQLAWPRMPRRPAIAISASGAFLVLAADQASKAWAMAALPREHDVTVIPGWLWFRLISNSGATLGLLGGHNRLLIAISLAVVAAVAVIVVFGISPRALGAPAPGAIGGGARSQLADRCKLGAGGG